MSCLPKPVLRGHIKKRGIQSILGAIAFAAMNVSLCYFFRNVPKKKRIEEFYKNYDAKAHTRDLIEWGYFQTVRPEDLRQD